MRAPWERHEAATIAKNLLLIGNSNEACDLLDLLNL
jgi:hypothetical protein